MTLSHTLRATRDGVPAWDDPAHDDTAAEREFTRIGVVGLGTMGAGIAEVFARNGFEVTGVEVTEEALERGRQHLEHSTGRAVARGKLTEAEQAELVGRITFTTSMKDLADADFVVEAVVESIEIKKAVFRALDDVVHDDAILATNTSSLSVTEISTASSHPGRVVGVHFFNPAPVQNLVEVIRTVVTEPDVLADVQTLLSRLGKSPVVCGDRAGFIANTLLFGYLNHAVSMYEAHYATREDIDAAMRYGCGYPMGPLALLDLIGLDTAYEILDTMYKQGRDRLHAPAPILKQMVTAGLLGRKCGRGFYTYEAADSSKVVPDHLTPSADDQPRLRRDIARVGVVGTGTMASASPRSSPRRATTSCYVGRSDAKVEAVQATIERSLDKAVQRGKLEEAARDQALGRVTGTTSLEDVADCDLVVEAIAEDLRVKTSAVREPRRDLQARRDPGHDHLVAADHHVRDGDQAPAGRDRPALLQPSAGDAPGRGRLHRWPPTTTSPRPYAPCARNVDKVAVSCGDRAGFIVNALLFPYLNDAVKMLEAHDADRRRASTPR